MTTPDSLNKVKEFMTLFGQPVLNTPTIPTKDRTDLRVNLIAEEANEFEEAVDSDDLLGIADALCDLEYVLIGAIHEFGLGDKYEELFNEVHRSNMSKLCSTEEEAIATVYHYAALDQPCKVVPVQDRWAVYRESDAKLLKSIGYSPADLKSILGTT